jgi:hypothetical protein
MSRDAFPDLQQWTFEGQANEPRMLVQPGRYGRHQRTECQPITWLNSRRQRPIFRPHPVIAQTE